MKKLLAAVLVMGLAFIACKKEYSVETGQNANLTGAWEFKDSTTVLQAGNPLQYYIDDSSNPAQALMVYTGATANLSASISIEVLFPTGTAAVGSYQSANGQVTFSYNFNNSGRLYQVNGSSGQFSTENITVNITQISDSSVTGTFSGTALDSANRLVPIREGKFTYRRRSVVTPPVTVSAGTLGSALDTCTGAVVAGTYRKNTALTGANTVTLTVNVTTAGTYDISSDTLKGISFKSTGTFAATGVQTVTLPGAGTPTDSARALRFRVRYGTSNCTFLVKIDTAGTVVVPTGDYFPTTTNSNWSYDSANETGSLPDTSLVRSTGTNFTLLSNSFSIFTRNAGGGATPDSSYFRKGAGIYYEAINLSKLAPIGGIVETQFLKDNVQVNNTWEENYNVTITGVTSTVKLKHTILAKAVTATIGSISSTDVIKVKVDISVGSGAIFLPYATLERWYGRNIGYMYSKYTKTSTPSEFDEKKLRRYQVN